MNIIQISASPNGTRNLGIGGGPNLMAREVVTADDTHTDGLYWLLPWDLTQFGPAGEAVMAANGGKRYAWLWSSDHYDTNFGWARGSGIWLAFNNDIALPPKCGTEIIAQSFVVTGQGSPYDGTWNQMETPWLLWKVEDETDPFRLYVHGGNSSNGTGQHTLVYKSADLMEWERIGISHESAGGHAGYQRVFRNGENDYWSIGLRGTNTAGAIWTSTDAETFTRSVDNITYAIGNRIYGNAVGPSFTIGAQLYMIATEDSRHASLQEGQFIARVPITDDWGVPEDTSGLMRLSTTFEGTYPTPKYVQSVDYAIEDGIAHIFLKRGFFADLGLTGGADYGAGGGLDDQICDYYRYIIDETTARTSAPAGVRASVDGGVVTLQWYDALPQRTYRVYRATESDLSDKVLVGDVSAVQATDTPGVTGTRYYEVMTLNAGVEEQSRVVSPYVSSRSALVNEHVERALAAGAQIGTIDLDHLAWAENVLDEIGAKTELAAWVRTGFGHLKNESDVLSKIFCLGTTLKPRMGDLTLPTGNTTYSATAWDSRPGWAAATGAAQGYFGSGRLNNIRHLRSRGLTLIGSIRGTGVLFGSGEFTGSYFLQNSGNPSSVTMSFLGTADVHATTAANTASRVIGAVVTADLITTYVEGAPSSGTVRPATTTLTDQLNGRRGSGGSTTPFLGFGTNATKNTAAESSATRTYNFGSSSAPPGCGDLVVFERGLTEAQMETFMERLRAGP